MFKPTVACFILSSIFSQKNQDLCVFITRLGVSIVQSGQELHGTERFVADGLITEGECQNLISLLEVRNISVMSSVQMFKMCVSCNSVALPYFTF